MEHRNVNLEIPVSREQWQMLGRRAAALGPERGGFAWEEGAPEQIRVFLRHEEAAGTTWARYVTDDDRYGRAEREVALLRFNDGDPYAELEPPNRPDEPVITEQEERAMLHALETFVRDKWQQLMRESGLHYVRGHFPHE